MKTSPTSNGVTAAAAGAIRSGVGIACIVLGVLGIQPGRAELVDQIVAVANGRIITASDLTAHQELFAPAQQSRDEVIETLVDRQLLVEEADRFAIDQPDAGAIGRELDAVVRRVGGEEPFARSLGRLGWSVERVRAWITDDLRARDFLDQRIYFFVLIPPQDVTAYYETHPEEFSGMTLEQAREPIMTRLTQQRGEEKRRQFLAKLRDKARIRINPPASPEGSTPTRLAR